MFKLMKILKERNISYQELFRSCDVNNDGDVNIRELETVLTSMSSEFYQKDTQAIHNFFDIDRNNICSEKEFLQQLAKAERLLAQHYDRLAGRKPMGLNVRDDGMNNYIPGFS